MKNSTKPHKIGILTAGGDCPGLNAAIRGVGKTAIVENIHRVWNESGETYSLSTEDMVAFIDANLSDQANIYDIACFAEMIDEAPYHALFE